jgi:hypothetical protein
MHWMTEVRRSGRGGRSSCVARCRKEINAGGMCKVAARCEMGLAYGPEHQYDARQQILRDGQRSKGAPV